jgi:hypothetical protein
MNAIVSTAADDLDSATADFAAQWREMLTALGPAAIDPALVAVGNMTAMFRSVTMTAEADPVRAGVAFEALTAIAAALPVAIANSSGIG